MNKIYVTLTIIVFSTLYAVAQNGTIAKADKSYDRLELIEAQEKYNQVSEADVTEELLANLANTYYLTADYENAAIVFSKWYDKSLMKEADLLFKYSQSLKSNKDYDTSNKIRGEWLELLKGDLETKNYLKEIEKYSGRYTIENAPFNSSASEFAPAFYNNDLVFASNRTKRGLRKTIHSWNNQSFFELFKTSRNDSDEREIHKFKNTLNTKYHETTAIFTKDKKTVYFTRNNFIDNKYQQDTVGVNRLKLYRGQLGNNDQWLVEELPFNSNDFSVAHPALSPDESTLYFASDMPGGYGYSDLYQTTIIGQGFSTPLNLGETINTAGRDTFPFISSSGKLYFSSEGHLGLGGLDIFVTDISEEHYDNIVINIGEPINSPQDDFTFIIDETTRKGYFASNRLGGQGNDDIYSLLEKEPLIVQCEQQLRGVVIEDTTLSAISDATVLLVGKDGRVIETMQTNSDGEFQLNQLIKCDDEYELKVHKTGYLKEGAVVVKTSKVHEEVINTTFRLNKEELKVAIGTDLAKLLNLNPIYFDLDKSFIRNDAQIELEKVIEYMKENPSIIIDVRSHTDSRGNDAYNLALSERRNASTISYIVNDGQIDVSRLTGRGYGETELSNHCSNGVSCSKKEHQDNRRSEFIVISN